MRLFKLAQAYDDLLHMLDDPEVEEGAVLDTVDGIDAEFNDKGTATAKVILDLESRAKEMKEAAKRMNARAKTALNRADWLRGYLMASMQHYGMGKLEDAEVSVSVAKNPPSVEVDESVDVPADFMVEKTEIRIDKKALKEALDAGQEIPGVRIVQTQRLRIK